MLKVERGVPHTPTARLEVERCKLSHATFRFEAELLTPGTRQVRKKDVGASDATTIGAVLLRDSELSPRHASVKLKV